MRSSGDGAEMVSLEWAGRRHGDEVNCIERSGCYESQI